MWPQRAQVPPAYLSWVHSRHMVPSSLLVHCSQGLRCSRRPAACSHVSPHARFDAGAYKAILETAMQTTRAIKHLRRGKHCADASHHCLSIFSRDPFASWHAAGGSRSLVSIRGCAFRNVVGASHECGSVLFPRRPICLPRVLPWLIPHIRNPLFFRSSCWSLIRLFERSCNCVNAVTPHQTIDSRHDFSRVFGGLHAQPLGTAPCPEGK